jgi:hypothetical protein
MEICYIMLNVIRLTMAVTVSYYMVNYFYPIHKG